MLVSLDVVCVHCISQKLGGESFTSSTHFMTLSKWEEWNSGLVNRVVKQPLNENKTGPGHVGNRANFVMPA